MSCPVDATRTGDAARSGRADAFEDVVRGEYAQSHFLKPFPGPRGPRGVLTLLRIRRDINTLTQLREFWGKRVEFAVGPGRRMVFLFDSDDAEAVLVRSAKWTVKGPLLQRGKRLLGDGLLSSEGDLHRNQQRLSQPVLTPTRVPQYAQLMIDCAAEMCAGWEDGKTIDGGRELDKLALAIAGRTMFGYDFADEAEFIHQFMDEIRYQFNLATHPLAPILERLPLPRSRRFNRMTRELDAIINRVVEDENCNGEMLCRFVAGTASAQQLRDDLLILLLAGHETVAATLGFLFHQLAHNPEIRERVEAEVDAVCDGALPTTEQVLQLDYTRRTFQESLRLYPAIYDYTRAVTAPLQLHDGLLEPGLEIHIPAFAMHRDPAVWPDPERFDPDRFLPEHVAERPRFAWAPWGGGPRVCPGQHFAMLEAASAVAVICKNWRLDPAPDTKFALDFTFSLRPKDSTFVVTAR